jgi:hypothetical protein
LVNETDCEFLSVLLHSKSVLRHYLFHKWLYNLGRIPFALICFLDIFDIAAKQAPLAFTKCLVGLVAHTVLM